MSLCLLFFLHGCTSLTEYLHNGLKVGPNYAPPTAPLAANWIDSKSLLDADRRPKNDVDNLVRWWTVFNDGALDELIDSAAKQNLTLRQAGFRILQARAQRGIAVGELFPQLQFADGSRDRIATSRETAGIGSSSRQQYFSQWNFGFGLAWELDFWGRYRRAVEAADANLEASVDDFNDVRVTLLSDVAASYVQMRTLQKRIEYANLNVAIQRKTRDKAYDRRNLEKNAELILDQAQTLLKQTEASISELEISLRVTTNRLCILLGIPPEDLQRKLDPPEALNVLLGIPAGVLVQIPGAQEKVDPRQVPIGIPAGAAVRIPGPSDDFTIGVPADLLRRRPDVRRAERQAAAQSALIGVAAAEFYPHIYLSGTLGYSAEIFKNLFQPSALNGSFGPSFQWNILNYGRLRNNVRLQDARFQELLTAYQMSVLNAQQEVENGLVVYLKAQKRMQLQNESVEAAKKAERIARTLWEVNNVDFTTVSLIQQNLVQQQDTLAQSQGEIALGLIQIYKALGGGWQMDERRCAPAVSHSRWMRHVVEDRTPSPSPPPAATFGRPY